MDLQSVGEIATVVIAAASLVALGLTLRELNEARRYQRESTEVSRKRIVTDILLSVWGDEAERMFFYRLDYEDWAFKEDRFRKTSEERYLDQILYKIALLGNLLRSGNVVPSDVRQAEFFVFAAVGNKEVLKYFEFVKRDLPLGMAFNDAYGLFLYFCNLRIARGEAMQKSPQVERDLAEVKELKGRVLNLLADTPDKWWESLR